LTTNTSTGNDNLRVYNKGAICDHTLLSVST